MGVSETLVLYLVAGAAVAGTTWLRESAPNATLRLLLCCLFWPIFLPALLGQEPEVTESESSSDEALLQRRIERAEELLHQELGQLTGVAAQVLNRESDKLEQLKSSLHTIALRLQQMDAALNRQNRVEAQQTEVSVPQLGVPQLSTQSRQANLVRLERLRARTRLELERAVARVEEMSSRVALLRFAASPGGEAQALLDEISGTIDDITEGIRAVA